MEKKIVTGLISIVAVVVLVFAGFSTIGPNFSKANITEDGITATAEDSFGEYVESSHFVGSENSDVYHYPWCHYVDRINPENRIYFDTPEDAIAAGYRPCRVCNPPTSSMQMQTSSPVRTPSSRYVWKDSLNTSKFGESGIVSRVIDGDTIEVEGIGRIRLADINTSEIGTEEGKEAKEYVKGLCYQKKVYLDVDNLYITGKYGRIIAVVYIPYNETRYVNLNQLLLKEGYAEARDYPNEFNPDDWKGPLEYVRIH
jgi:Micrococcal nuclease (thermonuclease) homologs